MYNTGIVYITNYTSHNLDSNTCIAYIKNYINHPRYCNIVRGVRRKGHVPKPVVCLGGHFRTQNKKIHFYVESVSYTHLRAHET